MTKVLSVRQPWAQMIVDGYKPVENRNWRTNYRGKLLIHAGKTFDQDGYDWIAENMPDIPIIGMEFKRGGIIGGAELVDCITKGCRNLDQGRRYAWVHDSPWFFGDFGLVLDRYFTLPFVPCKGRLGLFPASAIVPG